MKPPSTISWPVATAICAARCRPCCWSTNTWKRSLRSFMRRSSMDRSGATFCINAVWRALPSSPGGALAIRARSDVAALDLFAQGLDQFRHLFEIRVDGERFAESVECALFVAEILHDHAEP